MDVPLFVIVCSVASDNSAQVHQSAVRTPDQSARSRKALQTIRRQQVASSRTKVDRKRAAELRKAYSNRVLASSVIKRGRPVIALQSTPTPKQVSSTPVSTKQKPSRHTSRVKPTHGTRLISSQLSASAMRQVHTSSGSKSHATPLKRRQPVAPESVQMLSSIVLSRSGDVQGSGRSNVTKKPSRPQVNDGVRQELQRLQASERESAARKRQFVRAYMKQKKAKQAKMLQRRAELAQEQAAKKAEALRRLDSFAKGKVSDARVQRNKKKQLRRRKKATSKAKAAAEAATAAADAISSDAGVQMKTPSPENPRILSSNKSAAEPSNATTASSEIAHIMNLQQQMKQVRQTSHTGVGEEIEAPKNSQQHVVEENILADAARILSAEKAAAEMAAAEKLAAEKAADAGRARRRQSPAGGASGDAARHRGQLPGIQRTQPWPDVHHGVASGFADGGRIARPAVSPAVLRCVDDGQIRNVPTRCCKRAVWCSRCRQASSVDFRLSTPS